ncbi:MAG: ABC transporter substrate-binding protein [Deltaproteobacteria bacterium]|nr:ABC transporter substrate-binding protein [Deltaproteobacteria bacterium]
MVRLIASLVAFISIFCAATLLLGCPKRVIINGVEVDYEEAARAAYDDALAARHRGDTEAALVKLDAFMAQFAESDLADDALAASGDLARELGQLRRSRDAYARLAHDHPDSPHAQRARLAMAQYDIDSGRANDAVAPLRTAYDRVSDPGEKMQLAVKLAQTLNASGEGAQALTWYLKAMEQSRTEEERRQLETLTRNLIESQLDFRAIREAAESIDTRSPAGEIVSFKLARIYCHLRDFTQCREAVDRYLEQHPSGQFAAPAREMANRLQQRLAVNPIVVGVVLPLTGKYKVYGERALYAIQLGAELAGKETRGGVTLAVRDDGGEPEGAARAIEELALKEHAIVVIGAILQNTAVAAALKAEELGVPLISFSRRNGLTELGGWIFRYGLTNKKQAKALAELAMDRLKMTRFAVLYPRIPYGVELMNDFWDEVDQRHGYLVGVEGYDHDETTFTGPVKKLVGRFSIGTRAEYANCVAKARELKRAFSRKKAIEECQSRLTPLVDFDAILIADDQRAAGLIAPTLQYEDIITTGDEDAIEDYKKTTGNESMKPVQLLGGAGWNDPILIERAGKYVRGALFVDGFNPDSGETQVQKFVTAFAEAHNSKPTLIEAQAHDGAKLVAAIIRGGSAPAPKTREEMRARLVGVKDFPGVTGVTSFDQSRDSITPLTIFTVDKDTIQVADLDSKSPKS